MHYDNYNLHCVISIHALLAESDRTSSGILAISLHFYPRSPCGERQRQPGYLFFIHLISIHALLAESDASHFMPSIGTFHFYPRSPCGERPREREPALSQSSISIHALLAESDTIVMVGLLMFNLISIHALLAESDYDTSSLMKCQAKFLSTLSLRRATKTLRQFSCRNPISIHALLAESDL